MTANNCPFCSISAELTIAANSSCLAIPDGFPVSPGHALIVPRRHVASYFELTSDERSDMLALLDEIRTKLNTEYGPSGYNIGINEGTGGGQTIMHVHLHVIPRYENDVDDPRGGIRWVIPSKAKYWKDGS